MKTTCLINNYNYRRYVGEAVESALQQTYPFEKVVVVDDGSTDGSVEYLNARFGNDDRVVIVPKKHGGQLSCFNRGFSEVTTDLVFFLDADDRYCPNYVATAIDEYNRFPEVDLLCVSSRVLTDLRYPKVQLSGRTRDLGISVIGALLGGQWVGEKTSCLSMRTSIADKVLPFPYESEWITRADDVLVLGSSAVGAYKRHLDRPLVDYRVHESNHFTNKNYRDIEKVRRSLAINRVCNWFIRECGYELKLLPKFLHREFRTRESPTFKEWLAYQKIVFGSSLPIATVCKHVAATGWHYTSQKFRKTSDTKESVNFENKHTPISDVTEPIADAA